MRIERRSYCRSSNGVPDDPLHVLAKQKGTSVILTKALIDKIRMDDQ